MTITLTKGGVGDDYMAKSQSLTRNRDRGTDEQNMHSLQCIFPLEEDGLLPRAWVSHMEWDQGMENRGSRPVTWVSHMEWDQGITWNEIGCVKFLLETVQHTLFFFILFLTREQCYFFFFRSSRCYFVVQLGFNIANP